MAVDTETEVLFPELDTTKPEQKKLLALARAVNKIKAERDALLSTSKEKYDGAMQKLSAQMHECGIEKFKHDGVQAEIIPTKEKVVVTIEDEEQADEE